MRTTGATPSVVDIALTFSDWRWTFGRLVKYLCDRVMLAKEPLAIDTLRMYLFDNIPVSTLGDHTHVHNLLGWFQPHIQALSGATSDTQWEAVKWIKCDRQVRDRCLYMFHARVCGFCVRMCDVCMPMYARVVCM